MKRIIALTAFTLALVASAFASVRFVEAKAGVYCHTEIYCDYTGCHNIVVCN